MLSLVLPPVPFCDILRRYDEMLRTSNDSSWNISEGQDPRFINELLYFMSDALLACLAFCSLFPVPVSASLILLLPVTLVIQVRSPVFLCRRCMKAPYHL